MGREALGQNRQSVSLTLSDQGHFQHHVGALVRCHVEETWVLVREAVAPGEQVTF